MKDFISKNDLIEKRDRYFASFYKTGNPYFFLIAQELNLSLQAKVENDKNKVLEDELSL